MVIVAGNRVRRRQYVFDRRVEPPIDAGANQLAADDEHEQRWNKRHPKEHRHELGSEARERQSLAALDDQLDDVARQNEREAEQHREVGCPQRVQHELGEKVRREAGRSVGQQHDADQGRHQQQHARENEPRIVAKRPPALRRLAARPRWRKRRRKFAGRNSHK